LGIGIHGDAGLSAASVVEANRGLGRRWRRWVEI
jgi:hypothetical protein